MSTSILSVPGKQEPQSLRNLKIPSMATVATARRIRKVISGTSLKRSRNTQSRSALPDNPADEFQSRPPRGFGTIDLRDERTRAYQAAAADRRKALRLRGKPISDAGTLHVIGSDDSKVESGARKS